jgi:recombination protein RecA
VQTVRPLREQPNLAEKALARPGWSLGELAGRLCELSGRGAVSSLTAAATLLLEAQRAGEPCAWVTREGSTFFPPDLAGAGIDLGALVVVFVAQAAQAARAAARLVRSGAFGVVVLDLGAEADIPIPLQGRLCGLALQHDAAIVLITDKPASAPSVSSMVSLRLEARRTRQGDASFRLSFAVLKDKRRGPGWTHEAVAHGPAGLR